MFVIDGRLGVTAADQDLADDLRRQRKTVLLVANKCEGRVAEAQLAEAWSLGLGEPLPVSAEHGDGIPDLAVFDNLQGQIFIAILLGDGRGGFGEPSNVRIQQRLSFLSAADLNLDGRDDLIYTHGFIGDTVFVILSNPEGGFGAPVGCSSANSDSCPGAP